MGGYGSGRYTRWSGNGLVEHHRSLDIRKLKKAGLLSLGQWSGWQWLVDGRQVASISIFGGFHAITLSYSVHDGDAVPQDVSESVTLSWRACHLGGQRPWFLCPGNGCGRRVAKLYCGSVGYFLCRTCYGLAYESQRRDLSDRRMEKARRIRIRLGGSVSLAEPFPPKPKWMRWRTYWRLRMESEQAYLVSWQAMAERFGLLSGM